MTEIAAPIDDLFLQFLDIYNQAIAAHKEEFPYKYIWEAAEKLQTTNGMHVTVYDDEPKGDYQLRLQDKHIELIEPDGQGSQGLRINKSYMKRVLENSRDYINEPAKLDWDWLKNWQES